MGNCCAGPRTPPPASSDPNKQESQVNHFAELSSNITLLETTVTQLLLQVSSLADKLRSHLEEIKAVYEDLDTLPPSKNAQKTEKNKEMEKNWKEFVEKTKQEIAGYTQKSVVFDNNLTEFETKIRKKQKSGHLPDTLSKEIPALERKISSSKRNMAVLKSFLSDFEGLNADIDTVNIRKTLGNLGKKEMERGSFRLSVASTGSRLTATSMTDVTDLYLDLRPSVTGLEAGSYSNPQGKEYVVEFLDENEQVMSTDVLSSERFLWNQQEEYEELVRNNVLRRVYVRYCGGKVEKMTRKEVSTVFSQLLTAKLEHDKAGKGPNSPMDEFVLEYFVKGSGKTGVEKLVSFLEGVKANAEERRAEAEVQTMLLGVFTRKPLPAAVATPIAHVMVLAEQVLLLEASHLEMALRQSKPVPMTASAGWMPLEHALALAYRLFSPHFIEEGCDFVESIRPSQVSPSEYARFCILFHLQFTRKDGNSLFQRISNGRRQASYSSFLLGLQDTLVSPQGLRELYEVMEEDGQEGLSRTLFLNAFNLNRYYNAKESVVFRVSRQMLFDRIVKSAMDARSRSIGALGEIYGRSGGKQAGIEAEEMVKLLANVGALLSPEDTVRRYVQERRNTLLKLKDLVKIAEKYGVLAKTVPHLSVDGEVKSSLEEVEQSEEVATVLSSLPN